MPLSNLLAAEKAGGVGGKRGAAAAGHPAPKRRKERLKPFAFGPEELADLAVARRAFVSAKRDTSPPVTSRSNLIARKWPREYALSKQATGVKCTAQKVMEAIEGNLLNKYTDTWGWRGGWPPAAELYPPCKISLQHADY